MIKQFYFKQFNLASVIGLGTVLVSNGVDVGAMIIIE